MKVLVLPGDGIGEEITRATLEVLGRADQRFGLGLDLDHEEIGLAALEKHGTTCPDGLLDRARASDGILLGPISHLHYPPRDQGGINVSALFRVELNLHANVRPARTRPGLDHVGRPMDLVIMREATEGFYADRNMWAGTGEFMPTPDMALSVRKVTAEACNRIARRAFELAETRNRKVTAVHKANVMILGDGLFLREVRAVAEDFPDCRLDELLIDACCAWLVRDPARFDVICATNFYGDILSDLASELCGGLGLAGAINVGDGLAAAQAQHGSAPDIAGQNVANPTSLILSAAMLLAWWGKERGLGAFERAARAIEASVDRALLEPATRTRDLGGTLATDAFARVVADGVA